MMSIEKVKEILVLQVESITRKQIKTGIHRRFRMKQNVFWLLLPLMMMEKNSYVRNTRLSVYFHDERNR